MNIQIATSGNITDFKGDVIILPCDTELTYTKSFAPDPKYPLFHESKKSLMKGVFEKAGKELVRELTTIGSCEIGNAVITKGYELKVGNVIFMPLTDHRNEDTRISYVDLHQSLRNAFTMAEIYKAKSIAIGAIKIPQGKKSVTDFISKTLKQFWEDKSEPKLISNDEIEDIVVAVLRDFEKSTISSLCIYKYSK